MSAFTTSIQYCTHGCSQWNKEKTEREGEREGEGAKLEGYITRRQAVPHSYSNPDRGVGIMVKEQNETHINS